MKDSVVKDYEKLVRQLDVALNGEAGAAKQAALVDIVGQVEARVRQRGAPLLTPSPTVAWITRDGLERLKDVPGIHERSVCNQRFGLYDIPLCAQVQP